MSISVSVDTTKLNEIIAKLPGNRDKIIRATAAHILGEARKRAPVKTGALRDNSDAVDYGDFWNVEFYAEYAPYVELGTYKMYARPFLRTSVETERQNFIERLKKDLIK